MFSIFRRSGLLLLIFAFALGEPEAAANPVGDFFKKVGRSISKYRTTPTPTPTPRRHSRKSSRGDDAEAVAPEVTPTPSPEMPSATPTPTPLEIRPATSAPPDSRRSRDLPYGVAVPDRPGLVTSPYAPNEGYVDVRAFPRSTEVMDPFTGKVFLTP
ncbi:MAG: hypothetical protein ABI540_07040 [Spartobacteria bacterium]